MQSFEYYNNKLCVQARWLIDSGVMTEANYKKMTRTGVIEIGRRACLNTPALAVYDSIPERFKTKVTEIVGSDPRVEATKGQFEASIVIDQPARDFYDTYELESGERLPKDVQREYVANAEILNALHSFLNSRAASKKVLGGSKTGLWPKLAASVESLNKKLYPHSLPSNLRRLQDKYKRYIGEGTRDYESLIHGNWCNKNSEKVNDEAKVWLLSRWTSMVNRVATEAQLLAEYNLMAEAQGWKILKSENTLHLFLFSEGVKDLWWAARYGELKYKEKYTYQQKTILPTMRDSLWYSDGTKLNYFYGYRDENNRYKVGTTQVYVVMDVFSEAMIGYHISPTEDYIAQYNAYRMALQTSGQKPFQITYDNQGGHKKLQAGNFLSQLAHLGIPTKPYNGKSKTIESAFGRFQMQFLKKDWYFTGQNIQAKEEESKANMEFITANRHNLPSLDGISEAFKKRLNEWNNAKRPGSEQTRLELYNASANPRAVKLGLMDMVELFWVLREKPIQATAYGISFVEKGERYDYMVNGADGMPDVRWLAKNIDKKFRIKFDPSDHSLIYLYEDTPQGLRFITHADEKVAIHRGKQEQEAGEMEWFAKVEKAIEEMRIENDQYIRNIQERFNELPEQNGLVTPRIKGISTAKQGKKASQPSDNFGRLQKAISNAVAVTVDDEEFNEDDLYNLM